MASPMVDGRSLNPREKAHFSLHVSDRISQGDSSSGSFSSVKYNHKPRQNAASRTSTLAATSADRYSLTLQDKDGDQRIMKTTFTGQKQAPKRSYVLLLDPTTQRATLEPLSSIYTFNVSTQNGKDKSTAHPKIFPKRQKDEPTLAPAADDDLFDEGAKGDKEDDEPDPDNPFDFRHFLSKDKDKQGNESPFAIPNSPDDRAATGSAANTPLMPARRPAAAVAAKPKPSQAAPKARKRKSPEADPLVSRKPTTKKPQATPTVRLDRRASARPNADAPVASKTGRKGPGAKAAQPPASRIKSAEIVHSSDESDVDAEGEVVSSPPAPAQPSPAYQDPQSDRGEEDEDEDMGDGGLEIEVPDARPSRPRGALASLGLGSSIGLGSLSHLKSPSNGPISLASAASSVEGSPNPAFTPQKAGRRKTMDEDVIDFGDMGGRNDSDDEEDGRYEEDGEDGFEDRDVDPIDLGPPAQQNSASARKLSVGGMAAEEDEDDPLYAEMMKGFAGGDSSEESEEE